MTTPGSPPPGGAYVIGSTYGSDLTEESAKAIMKGGTVGSFSNAQNAHQSQVSNVINDHTQSITLLQEQFDQLILQGNAIVFTSNNTYTPSAGILSVDVILIGAGAGGAAGRWDLVAANRRSGGGGGGGGEVHCNIPASLLATDNGSGNFSPINITIGAGGPGGTDDAGPGTGGGDTSFGGQITAGGGQGGLASDAMGGLGGLGGVGMIQGGSGGRGGPMQSGTSNAGPSPGGNSTSPYDLHGGGGGGGGGAGFAGGPGRDGGIGGISPGGTPSNPGVAPSAVVATGGGGGGGGFSEGSSGGAGAYPAGGGGGGGGGSGARGNGGGGGNAILYVIERFT